MLKRLTEPPRNTNHFITKNKKYIYFIPHMRRKDIENERKQITLFKNQFL